MPLANGYLLSPKEGEMRLQSFAMPEKLHAARE